MNIGDRVSLKRPNGNRLYGEVVGVSGDKFRVRCDSQSSFKRVNLLPYTGPDLWRREENLRREQ